MLCYSPQHFGGSSLQQLTKEKILFNFQGFWEEVDALFMHTEYSLFASLFKTQATKDIRLLILRTKSNTARFIISNHKFYRYSKSMNSWRGSHIAWMWLIRTECSQENTFTKSTSLSNLLTEKLKTLVLMARSLFKNLSNKFSMT